MAMAVMAFQFLLEKGDVVSLGARVLDLLLFPIEVAQVNGHCSLQRIRHPIQLSPTHALFNNVLSSFLSLHENGFQYARCLFISIKKQAGNGPSRRHI